MTTSGTVGHVLQRAGRVGIFVGCGIISRAAAVLRITSNSRLAMAA